MRILSFDVGGSKISYALVDENGGLCAPAVKIKTPDNADEIEAFFKKILQEINSDGVSIATAGVVLNDKLCGKPNNLPAGYEQIDFAKMAQRPFLMENDANAAMWAEFKVGALRNVKQGVMLTLGTDVGCGLICNGTMVRGKSGAAGEISLSFSGRDMQKAAVENGLLENDCFKIHQLAQQNVKPAQKVYQVWEEHLVGGIKMLNRLLDTEIFALSGSLAQIVNYDSVNASLADLPEQNRPLVKPAQCRNEAGIIGAALLLKEKL